MRSTVLIFTAIFAALPLLAAKPTNEEVLAVYTEYQKAVCGDDCPDPITDMQTRILLLRSYCENGGTGIADCEPVKKWSARPALSFDHRQQDWTAEKSINRRTQEDVNGIPTVDLARGQTVIVVVTNTNPLLYTATPGKITLTPIEQFSDLQKLAGLVGGNLAAIEAARASRAELEAQGAGPLTDATEALVSAADDYIAGQRLADCVNGKVQLATNFVQAVEVGRQDAYPRDLPQCNGKALTGEAVRNLTQDLVRARETLTRRCPELPEAVAALLAADPAKVDEVRELLEKYEATTFATNCANWHADPNVAGEIKTRIVEPIQEKLGDVAALKIVYAGLEGTLGDDVRSLAKTARGVKAAEEPLGKLVIAWPTVGKAAENLDIFRERLLQNVAGKLEPCSNAEPARLCVPHSAVATYIIVPGGPSRVTRWESLHSRPIKIAAESPYAADVSARRGTVDTSYNLRSNLASIFDVGVSVTRTDLQSPTYGAVKRKTATDPTETNRVTLLDEETQSGKLALMLNILPLRLFDLPKPVQALGVQIGAATDSTKPALFWGLSYGLGKYIRLGWGRTSQRVNQLREEETPLDFPVGSKDEIRTRKDYKEDQYWSLMVSIRALRLFTTP